MFVKKNSVQAIVDYLKEGLVALYPLAEAEAIIAVLFEHYHSWNRVDINLKSEEQLSESELLKLHHALKELKEFRPIQYVLGVANFYNLKFMVNEHVLIPRQETEELVDLIINEVDNGKSIIDIGSGSGCISVSCKKSKNLSAVYAVDIDPLALQLVSDNAKQYNLEIETIRMDVLNWSDHERKYDVVVSNPPYVLEKEKASMHQNVLRYEPELALFVQDHEPIVFYEHIADFSVKHLNTNGSIYFEVNEKFANEVAACLKFRNFKKIRVIKDLNGKDRIVTAIV
ncbi:MAG: peptide chain release factor N(5)-glutamine methyltransferase [Flavobacteriales bacterium]|nr:peptide chain release factor N(5)-glutamine methyltransferase [Flavobacteriales bacterium]